MMNASNLERRCSDCELKKKGCSTWEEKTEKTVSGWDKNRFAIYCMEFTREDKNDRY